MVNNYKILLNFWFDNKNSKKIFSADMEFDKLITEKFEAQYKQAKMGKLDHWKSEALSMLSLIITLDQLPRNMYRGTKQMYSTDEQASLLSKEAIKQGFINQVAKEQQSFFIMPLMHAENIEDQKICLAEAKKINSEQLFKYAQNHWVVIKKFGRFPHRNKILDRKSTKEEIDFLSQNPRGF